MDPSRVKLFPTDDKYTYGVGNYRVPFGSNTDFKGELMKNTKPTGLVASFSSGVIAKEGYANELLYRDDITGEDPSSFGGQYVMQNNHCANWDSVVFHMPPVDLVSGNIFKRNEKSFYCWSIHAVKVKRVEHQSAAEHTLVFPSKKSDRPVTEIPRVLICGKDYLTDAVRPIGVQEGEGTGGDIGVLLSKTLSCNISYGAEEKDVANGWKCNTDVVLQDGGHSYHCGANLMLAAQDDDIAKVKMLGAVRHGKAANTTWGLGTTKFSTHLSTFSLLPEDQRTEELCGRAYSTRNEGGENIEAHATVNFTQPLILDTLAAYKGQTLAGRRAPQSIMVGGWSHRNTDGDHYKVPIGTTTSVSMGMVGLEGNDREKWSFDPAPNASKSHGYAPIDCSSMAQYSYESVENAGPKTSTDYTTLAAKDDKGIIRQAAVSREGHLKVVCYGGVNGDDCKPRVLNVDPQGILQTMAYGGIMGSEQHPHPIQVTPSGLVVQESSTTGQILGKSCNWRTNTVDPNKEAGKLCPPGCSEKCCDPFGIPAAFREQEAFASQSTDSASMDEVEVDGCQMCERVMKQVEEESHEELRRELRAKALPNDMYWNTRTQHMRQEQVIILSGQKPPIRSDHYGFGQVKEGAALPTIGRQQIISSTMSDNIPSHNHTLGLPRVVRPGVGNSSLIPLSLYTTTRALTERDYSDADIVTFDIDHRKIDDPDVNKNGDMAFLEVRNVGAEQLDSHQPYYACTGGQGNDMFNLNAAIADESCVCHYPVMKYTKPAIDLFDGEHAVWSNASEVQNPGVLLDKQSLYVTTMDTTRSGEDGPIVKKNYTVQVLAEVVEVDFTFWAARYAEQYIRDRVQTASNTLSSWAPNSDPQDIIRHQIFSANTLDRHEENMRNVHWHEVVRSGNLHLNNEQMPAPFREYCRSLNAMRPMTNVATGRPLFSPPPSTPPQVPFKQARKRKLNFD